MTAELTYGVERIAMYLQDRPTIYDCDFAKNPPLKYGDVYKRAEWEWSSYNFEEADIAEHFAAFDHYESEAHRLLWRGVDRSKKGAALVAPGPRAARRSCRTRRTSAP